MADEGLLMRRGEVRRALGLSDWAMRQLVEGGVLMPLKFGERSRAFFRRSDVMDLVNRGK